MSVFTQLQRRIAQIRCEVFQTSWNPTAQRTGAKYLRARLRGPSMIDYYPERVSMSTVRDIAWDMDIPDPVEDQRLDDVEARRRRGKGPPKKLKAKNEGKTKKKKK